MGTLRDCSPPVAGPRVFSPRNPLHKPSHIRHADRRLNYLFSVTCKIRRASWKRAKDRLVPSRYPEHQIDSDLHQSQPIASGAQTTQTQIYLDCCKLMGRKEPSPCLSTCPLHPVS